ncbi:transposable element Tcb2 transposase [Trichonephila clavipes]|nr:transposable element Tcb2 transposase [Trichonephila clavipes]
MGKLPDLNAFDRGQIVGAQRRGHSISEIVRQRGFLRSTGSRVYSIPRIQGWLRIGRPAHEAPDAACWVETVQRHGGSFIIWSVLSWHRLVSLVRVPNSLNAIRYVEFLGDHRHPFMLFCYPHGNGVFLARQLHLSQVLLDVHSSDSSVINGPPRSPDINPIEHLWKVLEQGMKGHHTALTNHTELWTALANIWQVIPEESFQKLVESMPRHMAAVIKTRGDPTR